MTVVSIDGCRIAPGILVDSMDCATPLYGLQSVADIIPMTDPHMENGVEWLPFDCNMAEVYCNGCTFPGDTKTYHPQRPLRVATPFAVYGSWACSPVGFSLEEAQTRARKNLEYGEWRAIERTFWTGVAGATDTEMDLADTGVTDLTPVGGALSIVSGMAVLEDYLGEFSGCLGTIHAPRGLVSTMGSAFQLMIGGDTLRTHLGTLIAAGGGYNINTGPGGATPAVGEVWMYATGPVHIWQGEVFDTPPTSQAYSMVNREINDLAAVAERVVVVGYECGIAAARVKLDYGDN